MKNVVFVLSFILSAVSVEAHNVKWFNGFFGLPSSGPLELPIWPGALVPPSGVIGVVPSGGDETCSVTVKLKALDMEAAALLDVSVRGGAESAESKYID